MLGISGISLEGTKGRGGGEIWNWGEEEEDKEERTMRETRRKKEQKS